VSRHRKLIGVSGIALMAVGVWGMLSIGSDAVQNIQQGDYSAEQGKTFQMNSYVFLFALVAGLIALIYAAVSSQAESTRRRTISR
jgi:hypothetical protein